MKRSHVFIALLFAAIAFAQDRTPPVVLESAINVRGGTYEIDQTTGACRIMVNIDPVPDQKPAQWRQMGAAACTTFKAGLLRAAKLDQGVGNGAAP